MADFDRFDLNLLRVFQAIMEEHSLTRAARRLGLSQPAISYALGRLRTAFDDPLFARTPEGMLPTPTAEQLAVPIGRAIASIRETLRHGEQFDPGTASREFRLSMSDIGEQVFLPQLCAVLQEKAPRLRLDVTQVSVSDVTEHLRLGRLDFAIGNLPELKSTTRYERLFHEAYVCMTRQRADLPRQRLTRERFLAMSHVAVASSESGHHTIDTSLRDAGLHRHIALRVPHFTVIPTILLSTDWVVTLPRRVAFAFNQAGQFAIYALPVAIPEVEVTVHWHESYDNEEGNRWLRNMIVETLGENAARR